MENEFSLDELDNLELKFQDYFGPSRTIKPIRINTKSSKSKNNIRQRNQHNLKVQENEFQVYEKAQNVQKKVKRPVTYVQNTNNRKFQSNNPNANTYKKKEKQKKIYYGAGRASYKKFIKMKDPIAQKANWEHIYDINKTTIEKTKIQTAEIEILKTTGTLRKYEQKLDRASYKNEMKFATEKRFMHNTSFYGDENMSNFVQENVENDVQNYCLYTTDTFLLALMTVKHSQFPWYIWVMKDGKHIIFDKREQNENQSSYLDLHTVNENIQFEDDETTVLNWQRESTHVLKTLQHKCQTGDVWEIGEEMNQVQGVSPDTHQAFKYVKTNIDKKYDVYTRVAIDAYVEQKVEEEDEVEKVPIMIRTINEYDHASEWRKKLEVRPGEVMSQQQLHNLCNLTKWLCQMELTETQQIKVISTSRTNPKDDRQHAILNVDTMTQKQFRDKIQFDTLECWKVVKHFLDFITSVNKSNNKQEEIEDGSYVMIKNAFKQNINLKRIPNADESEEEEDEDEDGEGEEGEDEEEKDQE